MGARKMRRALFFSENPCCCFCGGNEPATTEDHQPARTYFENRAWPEGFVFPACQACNEVTRKSEKILSLLIIGNSKKLDNDRYIDLAKSIVREYPDLIESMIPKNGSEIRRILRENGLKKPVGHPYSNFPILKLDRDFWDEHITNVGRKIILALHYQCFGEPLSSNGGMSLWFHTNFDWAAGRFPEEILELTENFVLPVRQARYLGDQFSVRWTFVEEPRCGLFIVHLQGALTISGITSERPADFKQMIYRPWSW